MQATSDEIVGLAKLQKLDQQIVKLKRELDELPQKQKIADIRSKRAALKAKAEKITLMRRDAQVKLNHVRTEDEQLASKQRRSQELIDEAAGDYRSVNVHTKELASFAKRRESLSGELSQLTARLDEVNKVAADVEGALQAFDAREAELTESYKQVGGQLVNRIGSLQASRDQLAATISPQLVKTYERIAKSKGGVALAMLQENACSTCRFAFDQSKVLSIRSEAPIATCPSCGRLLIVERPYKG